MSDHRVGSVPMLPSNSVARTCSTLGVLTPVIEEFGKHLHEMTAGWPLGLQMAASAIERAPLLSAAVAQLNTHWQTSSCAAPPWTR